MNDLFNYPIASYYRHKDGGIYQTTGRTKLTTTGEDAILYRHVWPFEESDWCRPASEFTEDRFTRISVAELQTVFVSDRDAYQEEVKSNKARRKLAEKEIYE